MSAAIVWDGMDECRALFARLRESVENPTEVLNTIGHELTESTKERISDTKTEPDGTPWKPLTEDYAKRKRKHSSGGLLEYTGNLLQSMTYNVLNTTQVAVGATEDYAEYVQADRPFLGISYDDSNAINQFVKDALSEV